MKKLVWKELTEQRYIPGAYAGFLITIVAIWSVMGNYVATHGGQLSDRISTGGISGLFWMILPWSGLLVTSSGISSEVGSGTLSFLCALPVSRGRIWWSKLLAQLASVGLTAALITAVSLLSVLCLFGQAGLKGFVSMDHLRGAYGYSEMPFALCTFLIVLSLSNLMSTLTDRPLAAAGMALCFGVMGCYWIVGVSGARQYPSQDNILELLVVVSYLSCALLIASYVTFKKCASLGSSRRFLVSFVSLASLLGIPYLLGLGGMYVISYVLRLVELEMPSTIIWDRVRHGPLMGTSVTTRKVTMLNVDLEYGRVQVGRKYQAKFYVGTSNDWATAPITAETYSSDISATVLVRTRKNSEHKLITEYGLDYVFIPTGSSGDETRRINLLSTSGQVIATIDIKAHKTKGFFLPDNPITGNFRDRELM